MDLTAFQHLDQDIQAPRQVSRQLAGLLGQIERLGTQLTRMEALLQQLLDVGPHCLDQVVARVELQCHTIENEQRARQEGQVGGI